MYDAIVVGYGPVGATVANLLGRHGLRVRVVEQTADIFDKPRAIGGDHEMLRVMQWCGIGAELAAHVRRYQGSRYLGVDGEPIRQYQAPQPPDPLGWPPSFLFIQPEFEAMLRRATAARAGIEIELESRFIDQRATDQGVSVTVEDIGSGRRQVLETRFLLACDGATSAVRKSVGGALQDLGFDETWLVVDAWLLNESAVPQQNVQYCWPSRPGTYVMGPRNMRRWELKLLPGEDPDGFDMQRIREALAAFVDPSAIEIWRAAVYRFHALIARSWRVERVFLLGDAAHQTPPFMGQGLCSGIRDAANLAWKLAMVLKGVSGPALLDTYMQERLPHMRTLVNLAKDVGLVVGELDPVAAQARDASMREQMRRGTVETLRHRMVPPLTDGVLAQDEAGNLAALAGELFVQPVVRSGSGTERLLDDCSGQGFLLVATDAEAHDWPDAASRQILKRIGAQRIIVTQSGGSGDPIEQLVESDGVFAALAGRDGHRAILVRPDRYVYGAARAPRELNAMIAGLQRQLALI